MDYINYVKQSPMSMGGMGGVVGSYNFRAASGGTAAGNAYLGATGVWMNGGGGAISYKNISTTGNTADLVIVL